MGKISSYAAVVTPADADVVPVVQSGVTKKVALSVLKTYVGGTPAVDATKADKVAISPDPTGYVATFDSDGNLAKSDKTTAEIGGSTAPTPEAESDFQMAAGSPLAWVKKTLNETKAILGVGGSSFAEAIAQDDFLVGDGSPVSWARKTIDQVKTILGWDTKADKVATSPVPTDYLAKFDINGNLVVSAKQESDIGTSGPDATKADKVATSPAPTGYVAELDATGNIVKSAKLSSAIPPAAEAENDFLVAGAFPFAWAKKTMAQVKTILGLGGSVPAPTAASDFMVAEGSPVDWVKKTLAETQTLLGVSSGAGIPVAAAGGTVDAITADFTPDITLADQKIVAVVAAGANTSTTPTFAPDGLTAHTIVKNGGAALAAGDIAAAGHVIILEYNLANTRWELLNPKAAGGSVDLAEPGPIGGTTPNTGVFTTISAGVIRTTHADDANLSVAECRGGFVEVSAAKTMTLPTGVSGYNLIVYSSGANVISVKPYSSSPAEVITLNGVALTAAHKISSLGMAGDCVSLIHNGTNWIVIGPSVWIDGGT